MGIPHFRINPDRMIYLCLCRYGTGLAWAERDVGRTNKRDTIEDIRNGDLPDVVQVIELNYVEFSSRDVTEDMLREVVGITGPDPTTGQFRVEWVNDHARDHRKHEVV